MDIDRKAIKVLTPGNIDLKVELYEKNSNITFSTRDGNKRKTHKNEAWKGRAESVRMRWSFPAECSRCTLIMLVASGRD